MRLFLIILLGKIISTVSRLFNLGAGGTWPGEMALLLDKDIFLKLSRGLSNKIIIVAGTNGKTTTAKMINDILSKKTQKSVKVIQNITGGNVLNGIISTLVTKADFKGRIEADWLIFEVDEATLPLILEKITPKIIVLLNLFRDQLDRYGEVDIIAEKWLKTLRKLPKKTRLLLNADDPQIASIGKKLELQVYYFGLNNNNLFLNKIPYAMDSSYCPLCQAKLSYHGFFLSHLGDWYCQKCGFTRPKIDIDEKNWNFPLDGVYNRYNTLAAILVGKVINLRDTGIKSALKKFQPAFGRQEEFYINGQKVKIYLSKNPTGMNETIRTVTNNIKPASRQGGHLTFNNKNQTVLLVLNDRIPDGKDVSWIWDVDFEELLSSFMQIIVSGDRAYDMGLRLKYTNIQITNKNLAFGKNLDPPNWRIKQINHQINKLQIIEDLKKAIKLGLEKTRKGETLYILPTYSGMLEVRKILIGRKIL